MTFDLEAVFARNRALFGDLRMVEEGDENADEKTDPPKNEKTDPPKDDKPEWYKAMSEEARGKYDDAVKEGRKHEDRAKALRTTVSNNTTELENLRRASLTDTQKAGEDAAKAKEAEIVGRMAPKLVSAEFRAQAAKANVEVSPEFLDSLDLAKFLDDDGEVDSAKVGKVLATLGTKKEVLKDGPGVSALGRKHGVVSSGVAAGAEMYEKLHPAAAGTSAARDWSK